MWYCIGIDSNNGALFRFLVKLKSKNRFCIDSNNGAFHGIGSTNLNKCNICV